MPNCKNCGARITKFDKDICPVCGCKNPLQGVTSETVEITTQIDVSQFQEGQKVVCRRKIVLLLFCLIGFIGAPFFYLKHKKFALIYLIINVLVLGGLFALSYFLLGWPVVAAILAPIGIVYLVNIVLGIVYYFLPDLKDGEGAFVV